MEQKYLKMIRKMNDAPSQGKDWSVYIVRCSDTTFYTGIAKNLDHRIEAHNKGKGAAYTRSRRPVELLYQEGPLTHSQALVREAKIKALPRQKKEALTSSPTTDAPYVSR